MENRRQKMKVIYTVVERQSGKSYWTRIGVAYANRDGSLNVRLDAIPLNGMLQVREWEPWDRRAENDDRYDDRFPVNTDAEAGVAAVAAATSGSPKKDATAGSLI